MEKCENFVARVLSDGRITIPMTIQELLNIKEGDFVEVKIAKKKATIHPLKGT